ncbi:MAG: GNAT family N-acetyltransferase [Patescibacteria group bacterium]
MDFEKNNRAEKEPIIKTKTITAQDLKDYIYKGESLPQDERFLSTKEGGVFKYFALEDLIDFREKDDNFYSVVEMDDKVVGLSGLKKDPDREKNLWMMFVSIDPKYQGKGYSRKLVEEVFEFAKNNGCSLRPSMYSEEGEKRLKRIIQEFAEKTSVQLVDNYGRNL